MGNHSLLQGIFPTQGSNPGLLLCRQILYLWSYQESHGDLNGKEIQKRGDVCHLSGEPSSEIHGWNFKFPVSSKEYLTSQVQSVSLPEDFAFPP